MEHTKKYFRPKEGKLVYTKTGETVESLTGQIFNVYANEDEYKGQKTKKICVSFCWDGDVHNSITFSEQGWFSYSFFSRLKNINIKEPVEVGVTPSTKNPKMNFAWMKQNGIEVEYDKNFIKPEKIKVGEVEINDWSKFSEAINPFIKRT